MYIELECLLALIHVAWPFVVVLVSAFVVLVVVIVSAFAVLFDTPLFFLHRIVPLATTSPPSTGAPATSPPVQVFPSLGWDQ